MATKISNNHLYTILLNAKKYHTPDVYVSLVHISVQVSDTDNNSRFIIQTGNDKKRTLVKVIKNFLNINRQTIINCLSEIEDLGLLVYNETLNAWELKEMINMLKEGYTSLNSILLEDFFKNLKLREKKLLLYMCHLLGTKDYKKFSNINQADFVINLTKKDSMWKKIISKSDSVYSLYYTRTVIEKFLTKMGDKIDNLSEEKRKVDFRPKEITQFIFYFNSNVSSKKYDENISIELKYARELEMIRSYIKTTEINLSKDKVYQLAHGIGSLGSWVLKEYVTRSIIKKYIAIQKHKSRVDIKSLPAYVAAVVKEVTKDLINFQKAQENRLNAINTNISKLAF